MREHSDESRDGKRDEQADDTTDKSPAHEQADGAEESASPRDGGSPREGGPGSARHRQSRPDGSQGDASAQPESAELRERREGFGGYEEAGGFGAEYGEGKPADAPDRQVGADADRADHDRNTGMRGYGDSGYGQSNDERGSEHLRSGEQRTGGFGYGAAGRAKEGDVTRAGAEQPKDGKAKLGGEGADQGSRRSADTADAGARGAEARNAPQDAQGDGDAAPEPTAAGAEQDGAHWQQGSMAHDGGDHGGSGAVTPASGNGKAGAGSESTQPTEPGAADDDEDDRQPARTSTTIGA